MSQDTIPEPHIRLRLLLALMRILAGRRGHSSAVWAAGGFRYVLTVVRTPDAGPVELDADATVRDVATIRERVRDALTPQP